MASVSIRVAIPGAISSLVHKLTGHPDKGMYTTFGIASIGFSICQLDSYISPQRLQIIDLISSR